jgi:DNA invertase Pin-like site-specific DNA recombinase
MIAAIYARKSTDQTGVADEQKSVARQVAHARAYAAQRGWIVDERFIFVDDGISGGMPRPLLKLGGGSGDSLRDVRR